ncbi:MAG: hypothetical protein JW741_30150, partial [Sedimentisphaerales bacterium]|nr:hypothetical protein [Sedimentisphaerales bacterium]
QAHADPSIAPVFPQNPLDRTDPAEVPSPALDEETTMTTKTDLRTFGTLFRFRHLPTARSFAARSPKSMAIVMGDCPDYWVVTLAQAKRMQDAGYEILEYA